MLPGGADRLLRDRFPAFRDAVMRVIKSAGDALKASAESVLCAHGIERGRNTMPKKRPPPVILTAAFQAEAGDSATLFVESPTEYLKRKSHEVRKRVTGQTMLLLILHSGILRPNTSLILKILRRIPPHAH